MGRPVPVKEMRCWPSAWMAAAVAAGLAYEYSDGSIHIFGGDSRREEMEAFAEALAAQGNTSAETAP